jgi:hypothetical protein
MTERCCELQGDAIVFGVPHDCTRKPAPKRESLASLAARASYVLHRDGRDPDNLWPFEDRLDASERGQC